MASIRSAIARFAIASLATIDAYGPAAGVPIDEWKNLWQYPDALDFGGL